MKKPTTTIERLRTYRLENDLTFDQLAAEISALGKPIKMRALYSAMTRPDPQPRELTLYKLNRFVRHIDGRNGHGHDPAPRRRRKAVKR
jgi:hypothetical protein